MISIKKLEGGQDQNIVPSECHCKLKLNDMAKLMLKDTLELYCQKNNINMHMQEEDDDLYTINSCGLSSLGSEPNKGKNAITQLIVFLNQFNLGQNDVSDFIKFLSNYIGEETDGKSLNIAYKEEDKGSITVNLGSISIDDDIAKCVIGITYPAGADYEDILRNILTITADKKIDVSILNSRRPLCIDENSYLVSTLLTSYKEVTGEDGFTISLGEQTFAKAFENMVSFGPVFPGEDGRNFMTDEYIGIDELIKCTKIYANAIYELAK
jgi:succinyl-diaminopimelate desuccinylase